MAQSIIVTADQIITMAADAPAVTTGPGGWIIGSRYDDGKMAEPTRLSQIQVLATWVAGERII